MQSVRAKLIVWLRDFESSAQISLVSGNEVPWKGSALCIARRGRVGGTAVLLVTKPYSQAVCPVTINKNKEDERTTPETYYYDSSRGTLTFKTKTLGDETDLERYLLPILLS